jgi:hypothetical protein
MNEIIEYREELKRELKQEKEISPKKALIALQCKPSIFALKKLISNFQGNGEYFLKYEDYKEHIIFLNHMFNKRNLYPKPIVIASLSIFLNSDLYLSNFPINDSILRKYLRKIKLQKKTPYKIKRKIKDKKTKEFKIIEFDLYEDHSKVRNRYLLAFNIYMLDKNKNTDKKDF